MLHFFSNLSIRTKLILIVMLISIITTSASILVSLRLEIADYKKKSINDVITKANLVGQYCVMPLEFKSPSAAIETLAKLRSDQFVIGAILFDSNNSIFAEYQRNPDEKVILPAGLMEEGPFLKDDFIHVLHRIEYKGIYYGTLYLQGHAGINEIISDKITTGLYIIAGILLLSFLLTTILQGYITAPIIKLKRFTSTISETKDYSLRIKQQSNDEIGNLYNEFNLLLNTLQKNEADKNEALDSLLSSEELARQNRNMLLNVIDTIPQSVFWKNREGVYQGCNKKFAHSYGNSTPQEIIGKNDYDLAPPPPGGQLYSRRQRSYGIGDSKASYSRRGYSRRRL